MTSTAFTSTVSSYRSAGWAAIASGITGIMAIAFLIMYLILRSENQDASIVMNRLHDAGVILQFILMMPVVFALLKLSQQKSPGLSRAMVNTGIVFLSLTVLFVLLGSFKVIADVLYMFPQGVFGVWLIVVCWRMPDILSRGLRWFGMVVGLGLALVGILPPGYAIFVDTIILRIPAASAEAVEKIPVTPANMILHQISFVGAFMGVLTYPIWIMLVGRRFFREENS